MSADPDLRTAVATALHGQYHGGPVLDCAPCFADAETALNVTGRVLAERLRADAAQFPPSGSSDDAASTLHTIRVTTGTIANLVERWCGDDDG